MVDELSSFNKPIKEFDFIQMSDVSEFVWDDRLFSKLMTEAQRIDYFKSTVKQIILTTGVYCNIGLCCT